VGEREAEGHTRILLASLGFTHWQRAFALQVVINPSGQIQRTLLYRRVSRATLVRCPLYQERTFTRLAVNVGKGSALLGGTLTIPNGRGLFPAAVLVHGSGANDRDETIFVNHPFKNLAEGLSSDDVTVLRTFETIPALNHSFIVGSGKLGSNEYSVPVALGGVAQGASFIKR
jgi:hypothetical protein